MKQQKEEKAVFEQIDSYTLILCLQHNFVNCNVMHTLSTENNAKVFQQLNRSLSELIDR